LRRNVSRVGELALLLLEVGDLLPQSGFGGGELLHLGALREIGADRAGDGERQHADNRRQDRSAPRGQTEPLLRPLLGRLGDRLFDRFNDFRHRTRRRRSATRGRRLARPPLFRIAGAARARGR